MARGGSVHQHCAARGIETTAGRLSAVVTEKGTIRTPVAIMAGGAWASSFCRQFDVRFPQASIRSSILSVSGGEQLPDALHTAHVSITRRGDGGYTLAISGRGRVDPTPQQMRFAPQFLPMFLRRWRSLAPGGAEGWRSGHETLARWRLDAPTPMEKMRILDPAPDHSTIALTYRRACELLPSLAKSHVTAAWAGYIDSTPDGVPGIGEIDSSRGSYSQLGSAAMGLALPQVPAIWSPILSPARTSGRPKSLSPETLQNCGLGKGFGFLSHKRPVMTGFLEQIRKAAVVQRLEDVAATQAPFSTNLTGTAIAYHRRYR